VMGLLGVRQAEERRLRLQPAMSVNKPNEHPGPAPAPAAAAAARGGRSPPPSACPCAPARLSARICRWEATSTANGSLRRRTGRAAAWSCLIR
jgi:hypothetical protein